MKKTLDEVMEEIRLDCIESLAEQLKHEYEGEDDFEEKFGPTDTFENTMALFLEKKVKEDHEYYCRQWVDSYPEYKMEIEGFFQVEPKLENTGICYLYRDASNYKASKTLVLRGKITEEQKKIIFDSCDGEFFIPQQVGLDRLYVDENETIDDHCWHELENIELTDEEVNTDISIEELVAAFKAASGKWDEEKYAYGLEDE